MQLIRTIPALLIPFFVSACCGCPWASEPADSAPAAAASSEISQAEMTQTEPSLYALSIQDLEGKDVDLSAYRGQVTLVVNTASRCGYTPQYEGLQQLQAEYGDQGFSVLGFPSGDFGGQEFSNSAEIREFCDEEFGVTFPLFAKAQVKGGEGQSPVYAFLEESTGSLPGWNFGKYLIDREGRVIAFYTSQVDPSGEELNGAIETALKQS